MDITPTPKAHRIIAGVLLVGGGSSRVGPERGHRPSWKPSLVSWRPPAEGLIAYRRRRLGAGSCESSLGHQCLSRLLHERQPGRGRNRLPVAPVPVVSVPTWHNPLAADTAHSQ